MARVDNHVFVVANDITNYGGLLPLKSYTWKQSWARTVPQRQRTQSHHVPCRWLARRLCRTRRV